MSALSTSFDPEPSEAEREAILAALEPAEGGLGDWAEAALLEGVESGEPNPYPAGRLRR